MLSNLKEIYLPKNLPEAVKILKKGKGKIIPLAGSTSIGMMSNPAVNGLLDIEPLKLNYIKSQNGKLLIGAGTRISEILSSRPANKFCNGILHQCSTAIGKIINRNMITVGGNIVQIRPWSSLPVMLLALDASIILVGQRRRSISASDFFSKAPKQIISYDEIVTEIQIPSVFANADGRYIKFSLTENDYPLISIAAVIKKRGKKVEFARISVGALTLLPQRLNKIEELLEKKELTQNLADEAAKLSSEVVNIGNDFRASKEYKKTIVENLVGEILKGLPKN